MQEKMTAQKAFEIACRKAGLQPGKTHISSGKNMIIKDALGNQYAVHVNADTIQLEKIRRQSVGRIRAELVGKRHRIGDRRKTAL